MLSDLRFAVRGLRRAPGFAATAVLLLAIGIGANATVFSWIEKLVLNPYPAVRESARLVTLVATVPSGTNATLPYSTYEAWRGAARSVDGVTAYELTRMGLQRDASVGGSEATWGAFATADYFRTLGVGARLGRVFVPADSVEGAPPVVVLGDALWRERFEADRRVVGRVVRINGVATTVVGVAAPGFEGAFAGLRFDLWVPLGAYTQLGGYANKLHSPYASWLAVFARLRPGVSLAQARAELAATTRDLPRVGTAAVPVALPVPFDAGPAGSTLGPLLMALLGVSGLVLLIVCANVANLQLARTAARSREFGVRIALGASRARIVRQLVIENLTLAIPGAALGIVIAQWGRGALGALLPPSSLPVDLDAPVDVRVLLAVTAIAVIAAVASGLAPALRAAHANVRPTLQTGRGGSTRWTLRGAFTVAQLSLSFVALLCAGLFLRSYVAARSLDPGFRGAEHVLLVSTDFSFAATHDVARVRAEVDRLVTESRALPGVTAAAVADFVPMGLSGGDNSSMFVPGYTPRPDESLSLGVNRVTPDYFRTMGIPLLRGRAFGDADRAPRPDAVIVNESFARHFYGGRDAVGQRFVLGVGQTPNVTIVGVVHDGIYGTVSTASSAPPFIYVPYAEEPVSGVTLHLRTDGDPLALVPAVRRLLAAVDPSLPLMAPTTLAEHAGSAFFLQRIGSVVLGLLGGVALLLAALGLYAVTAYEVAQRTREVGIRIALGAELRQVVVAFVARALRLTLVGLIIGGALAVAAGRLLASQLYGLDGTDPRVLAATALLLAAVALVATVIPARRAARVAPAVALRSE